MRRPVGAIALALLVAACAVSSAPLFAAGPPADSAGADTAVVATAPSGPVVASNRAALVQTSPEELARAREAAGRCATCHPRERTDFARGTHARGGVRCTSCHQGNDDALAEGAAHAGLVARPSRAAITSLCASCHSDPERMRVFGLPVDQAALHQTSAHGRRLAEGDRAAASCTDCHGVHESLPATDGRSPTHPMNVDRVCSRCHGDARTSAGARLKKDVTAEWAGSVHGPAHTGSGGEKPGCTSCHGVHGSAPATAGSSTQVCGRCHAPERHALDEGAHGRELDPHKRPECVTCHGGHAIRAADAASLATSCVECHQKGTPAEVLGAKLHEEYAGAEKAIHEAEELIRRADAVPLPTEDYHARLADAREALAEVASVTHYARHAEVREAAMRARSVGEEVKESVEHQLGHVAERWLMLAAFWLFTGLLLVILNRWRRNEGAR